MMKVLALAAFSLLWGGATQSLNFDANKPGALPPGWKTAVSQPGEPARWQVMRDPTAPSAPNVLAQVASQGDDDGSTVAIFDKARFRDGDVMVHFKPVSGGESVGVVFRYRDPKNYYLVRVSAREDNVAIFKVENGNRIPIPLKGKREEAVKHDIPARAWNMLHVRIRGAQFRVFYDHYRILEATDSTIGGPGYAGLWTKAGTVGYFDDFQLRY